MQQVLLYPARLHEVPCIVGSEPLRGYLAIEILQENSRMWRQGHGAERDGNCRTTHHASAGVVDSTIGQRGHRRLLGEGAHDILKSSDGHVGVLAPPSSRSLALKDTGRVSDRCDARGAGDGKAGSGVPGNDWGGSRAAKGFSPLSNRKLVRNAIKFLCLAGDHVKDRKARVLEVRLHLSYAIEDHHPCIGVVA